MRSDEGEIKQRPRGSHGLMASSAKKLCKTIGKLRSVDTLCKDALSSFNCVDCSPRRHFALQMQSHWSLESGSPQLIAIQ